MTYCCAAEARKKGMNCSGGPQVIKVRRLFNVAESLSLLLECPLDWLGTPRLPLARKQAPQCLVGANGLWIGTFGRLSNKFCAQKSKVIKPVAKVSFMT